MPKPFRILEPNYNVHVQTTYMQWAGLLDHADDSHVHQAWERGYLCVYRAVIQ